MELQQPTGYSNNDTSTSVTGKCIQGACPEYRGGTDDDNSSVDAGTTAARFRTYVERRKVL
jgi:1,3-beta-glucan synthase